MTKKATIQLDGQPIEEIRIKLEGTVGTFEIPNSPIKVKFFSTKASNRLKGSMEYNLLGELKPMRERTKSSEIEDLDVLFQRDLNDSRIAKSLVPYLSGVNSPVAFFPAVLGVLMPKGFLSSSKHEEYPVFKKEEETIVTYNNFWELELLKMGPKITSFGILSINPAKTSVLVLDGQHRSNAFRYVTNTFLKDEDGNEKNEIYSSFYEEKPPKDFYSDLPVTIIWFEDHNKNLIDPTLISRKLFVDVNNTSRKVNISRNILLDDFEVPCLLTRFFLSGVLKRNKFSVDKFSLIYSGFDTDSDANAKGSSNNPFVITSPQKIKEVMSWYFLGKNDYSVPKIYKVPSKGFLNNIAEFEETFKTKIGKSGNEWKMVISEPQKREFFKKEFESKCFDLFFNFYDNFIFYKKHYEICKELQKEISKGSNINEETWKKIFCGGEGLYYIFKEEEKRRSQLGQKKADKIQAYLKSIREIETNYYQTKEKQYSINLDLYKKYSSSIDDTLGSIAFQVGIFMAFKTYSKFDSQINTSDKFISILNSYTLEKWFYILGALKTEIIDSVDPSVWPSYHNILLKLIQQKDKSIKYFNKKEFHFLPEYKLFETKLLNQFESWIDADNNGVYPDSIKVVSKKVGNWKKNAYEEINNLFKNCGISNDLPVDLDKISNEIIVKNIKLNKNDDSNDDSNDEEN